jgi:predicted nuclease of restriction endonuclease-like (RecB) superfamily
MNDDEPVSLTPPPAGYADWLGDIKTQIHEAQQRAAQALNLHLVFLYWKIGRAILDQQEQQGWGAKIIDRLADDLRRNFPEMKGFSPRNLKYMRAFVVAWPDAGNCAPPAAQMEGGEIVQGVLGQLENSAFVHQMVDKLGSEAFVHHLVHKLPWRHHCVIMDKLKTREDRLWYAQKAIEHNWSRNILVMQIESRLIERSGGAVTNFALTLPKPQSDLARESLKDPYRFDFLGLGEEAQEREIENALVKHVTDFLLELGAGFAFVGRQVLLDVGGEEFFIDLLFYHLKLRCYVVIELKAGKFKPEHLGQLGFYLTAVDAQVKHPDDAPTIGLLLCKSKNKVVAEYALRDKSQPLGVAEYQLLESLPPEFQTSLPSIEQIEREFGGEPPPISEAPAKKAGKGGKAR